MTVEGVVPNSSEILEQNPDIAGDARLVAALSQIGRRLGDFYPDQADQQRDWWTRPNAVLDGNAPLLLVRQDPAHLLWLAYVLENSWQLRQAQ